MNKQESISEAVKRLEQQYNAERDEIQDLQRRVDLQKTMIRDKNDETRELRKKLHIYRFLSMSLTLLLALQVLLFVLEANC